MSRVRATVGKLERASQVAGHSNAGAMAAASIPDGPPEPYWSAEADILAQRLDTTPDGLSAVEAARRLREWGPNQVREHQRLTRTRVLMNQIRNPLLLVLVFAAVASAMTGEWVDAVIVVAIVLATVGIGYTREYQAETAAAALQARVRTRARVLRDGHAAEVPMDEIVPGDVVLLSAGSLVPADGVILEAADFFVSEAVLTGESFPVDKRPGTVAPTAGLRERLNCVFLGTNVRSGTARCLIVATGLRTQFGAIAHRLTLRPPETEFDRGLRRFGHLLTSAMLVMVFLVFIVHVLNGRPPIETLLFAVALAVGLSPELLPAILSVNLARGAQMMARHGVLVRHLTAIENLGSMDVLCTDKTGTLTEGLVVLEGAYDAWGAPSADVQRQGAWNAALETGLASPLDDAILSGAAPDLSAVRKLAEIPFDFVRKRVSVVVDTEGTTLLITKGAFHRVLEICARSADGVVLDDAGKDVWRSATRPGAPRGFGSWPWRHEPWTASPLTAGRWSGISPSSVSSRSLTGRKRTWPMPFEAWPRSASPSRSSQETASRSRNTLPLLSVCAPTAC